MRDAYDHALASDQRYLTAMRTAHRTGSPVEGALFTNRRPIHSTLFYLLGAALFAGFAYLVCLL